jgi:hypothetical protein
MKRINLYAIFVFFALSACTKKVEYKIETFFELDSSLFISKNLLKSEYSRQMAYDCDSFFLPQLGLCKKTDRGVVIRMSQCFMTGTALNITISNDSVFVIPSRFSCTYSYSYTTLHCKLILNSKEFRIGDTLKGRLEYVGVYNGDKTDPDPDVAKSNKLKINGEFEFKIRDKNFDYDKLYSEQRFFDFLKDIKNNPNEIKKLDLSNLELKELPKELSLCRNLVELDLSDNLLNESSDFSALKDLKKLKVVDLNFNKFELFPESIFEVTQIEEITFHANNIKVIPKGIVKLNNLESLTISYNEISEIPEYLLDLRNIKSIWIDGNKITNTDLSNIPPDKKRLIKSL